MKIHLLFGDTQYPDVDTSALEAVLRLAEDIKPDYVWLMGDMLNATTIGKFGYPADYKISFWDEIRGTRDLLQNITFRVRKANQKIQIAYLEGNHELRLQRYIDRNADKLAELTDAKGERVLAIDNLLDLKALGIIFVPYWSDAGIGNAYLLHGNLARVKSGYTAHAYIDRYGSSVIAGHTHRLGLIFKTQAGKSMFGLETGSLCKRNMVVPYIRANQADWQKGAAIVVEDNNQLYPYLLPINNSRLYWNNKMYSSSAIANDENTIFKFEDLRG